MIAKINFRYLGYIITAFGPLLMIYFAYTNIKQYQFISLSVSLIGLILTFESSRMRVFKFSMKDWITDGDSCFLEIKKIRHLKKYPIAKVFYLTKRGSLKEIHTGIMIGENATVKINAVEPFKEDTFIYI